MRLSIGRWSGSGNRSRAACCSERSQCERPKSIGALRQKSASAEQSVLDLIAGIGQMFEKPSVLPPEPPNGAAPANGTVVHEVDLEPEEVLSTPRGSGRKWRIPFVSSSS